MLGLLYWRYMTSREILNAISASRPGAGSATEQFHMTAESIEHQAQLVGPYMRDQRVLFFGRWRSHVSSPCHRALSITVACIELESLVERSPGVSTSIRHIQVSRRGMAPSCGLWGQCGCAAKHLAARSWCRGVWAILVFHGWRVLKSRSIGLLPVTTLWRRNWWSSLRIYRNKWRKLNFTKCTCSTDKHSKESVC